MKTRNFLYVTALSTAFLVLTQNVKAQEMSYYQAYDLCSPVALEITKQQCNYAQNFEIFYKNCMVEQGFSEYNEFDPQNYDRYLASYKYCSSIAEQQTQSNCSYGQLYKYNYTQCMFKHGYDENGQRIVNNNNKNNGDRYNNNETNPELGPILPPGKSGGRLNFLF